MNQLNILKNQSIQKQRTLHHWLLASRIMYAGLILFMGLKTSLLIRQWYQSKQAHAQRKVIVQNKQIAQSQNIALQKKIAELQKKTDKLNKYTLINHNPSQLFLELLTIKQPMTLDQCTINTKTIQLSLQIPSTMDPLDAINECKKMRALHNAKLSSIIKNNTNHTYTLSISATHTYGKS